MTLSKIKILFAFILLLFGFECLDALAARHSLKFSSVPAFQVLSEAKVRTVSICGGPQIIPTKKSLRKNFFLGEPSVGFMFSDLISNDEYYRIVVNDDYDSAKSKFEKLFSKTRLWEVHNQLRATDLGPPKKLKFIFTKTIKDCLLDKKSHWGHACSSESENTRKNCCSEKFPGIEVLWESPRGDFLLWYAPDPSLRMRVPGEKAHRYCHSMDLIENPKALEQ